MKKLFFIFILFSLLFSCGKEEKKDYTEFDRISFFDIVYETIAMRPTGDQTWIKTTGRKEIKFNTTTKVNENDEIPNELEGNFVSVLENYLYNQSVGACSGVWSGTFSLDLFASQKVDTESTDDGINNVLDPYNPPDVSVENGADSEKILIYTFSLVSSKINLFPEESCTKPYSKEDVIVHRYPNGTIIFEDKSLGIEYYMRPKLIGREL